MTDMNIEVVRSGGRWRVRHIIVPNVWGQIANYRLKHDAVVVARFYARQRAADGQMVVELIIKNIFGRIQEKNTYGHDPEETVG